LPGRSFLPVPHFISPLLQIERVGILPALNPHKEITVLLVKLRPACRSKI
jgi:hypothetical protein